MAKSEPPEILYHFTSRPAWEFIQLEGIDRGDAPTSLDSALSHPNLTSNPDHGAQEWCRTTGTAHLPMLIRKDVVRIAVHVPPGDDRLISWREWTDLHRMPRRDYRKLDETGGWQARHWWIYRGTVPAAWFGDVTFFDHDQLNPGEALLLLAARKSPSYDAMMAEIGGRRQGDVTMTDLGKLVRLLAS